MIRRVLLAALLSGIAAALLMSGAQHLRVVPLIVEAERYETASPAEAGHTHTHSHSHDTAATEPGEASGIDWPRTAQTVMSNVITGVSFALLLTAVALLVNLPLTPANGLTWGFLGFVTFSLAPAIGLPPELPGMPAADLVARQIWWWQAVIATGGGLLLMAKVRNIYAAAAGTLLIALPHLIGAPDPVTFESALPPHLASAYAANALGSALLLWALIGIFLGKGLNFTAKD